MRCKSHISAIHSFRYVISYHCQFLHKFSTMLCLDDLSLLYPLLWRFLPILDANVDTLLVRDLDSHISMREVAAVKQFMNSRKVRKNNDTVTLPC